MTQQKSLKVNEASKVLCRQSDDLCRAAKVVRLKSKHAREASAAQRLLRKNYSAFKETLNPMKLKIFLDTESYRCLTSCLSIAARTRTAILTAVLLGNTRVIDCDDVEARDLLLGTRSECPGAARRIIEAINLAGLTE
jgi:hypothetical protein